MQGWQHVANDILNITGRSLVMFFLTLAAVRLMGKRSIAELAPFDLAVVIIMGSVAALPLEEESIHLLHGIVPIVVMALLQVLLSVISMHWRGFEKVTQGTSRPIVVTVRCSGTTCTGRGCQRPTSTSCSETQESSVSRTLPWPYWSPPATSRSSRKKRPNP